jgi:GMP synthase-like glutamine amidotransferase
MNFHCLQHVSFEGLGFIETWIRQNHHSISFTRFYLGDSLPVQDSLDALIILGGYMSTHDEQDHPWLKGEKEFIAESYRKGKKIMGICLGSQIIAEVLGARVYPNPEKEIGFMPLILTAEARKNKLFRKFKEEWTSFHWHGETFTLPRGSVRLAYSEACENQAYWIPDTVLGLQFHLELTADMVKNMVREGVHELVPAPYIQAREKMIDELFYQEANKESLFSLLDEFFKNPNL